MPKVICTLPNASSEINGVKFVSHKQGMISEEIPEDVAKSLTSIPGYHLHDSKTGGIAQPDAGTAQVPQPQADTAGEQKGAQSVNVATPESLASAAQNFTPTDRQRLIKLLIEQQPRGGSQQQPTSPRPPAAPASRAPESAAREEAPPPGSPAPSDKDGSDAPSSSPSPRTPKSSKTAKAEGKSDDPTF